MSFKILYTFVFCARLLNVRLSVYILHNVCVCGCVRAHEFLIKAKYAYDVNTRTQRHIQRI